ncbi:MAG: multidrug ABC transporter ATP-binding protein, partial [Thermoguttaceae bacterium]|nr:multidrug ABC transporter ATP-binding protein [Thermoguttaceae bacterium]
LPDLAEICNKVGIIERGDLLDNAEESDIMRKVRDRPVLIVELLESAGGPRDRSADDALRFLSDQPEVESVDHRKDQIVVTVKKGVTLDAYAELLPRLIAEGFRIRSFREEEINLETAFMTLTKGMTA